MAMESKTLESLHIDVKKGEFLLNGKKLKAVSHLELEFNNGKWSLLVTKDELHKQVLDEIRAQHPEDYFYLKGWIHCLLQKSKLDDSHQRNPTKQLV